MTQKKRLSKIDENKILETELYISKTSDDKNSYFSAVDHFVRLNKNVFTIKDNTYRMWSLTADRKILEQEKEITSKFYGTVLPKINQKRSANMITLKLACLCYYNKQKEMVKNDYSNFKVTAWLKEFNKEKEKNMFKAQEKISELRDKYFRTLDEVNNFYHKIDHFLEKEDKLITELFHAKKSANTSLSNYYYLFMMLYHISEADLLENSSKIYNFVQDFYTKIKTLKYSNEDINNLLDFNIQQISVFDSNKRDAFKEKMRFLLNESL